MKSKPRFKVGDRIKDDDGWIGRVTKVRIKKNEVLYDVKWDNGYTDTNEWTLASFQRVSSGIDRVLDEM